MCQQQKLFISFFSLLTIGISADCIIINITMSRSMIQLLCENINYGKKKSTLDKSDLIKTKWNEYLCSVGVIYNLRFLWNGLKLFQILLKECCA